MIFRSAPPPRPSVTRIQVERIRLGQVIGWVASPDAPALQALQWLVDGQPRSVAPQWQARDDVVASTGVAARGFVLDLPPDTWPTAAGGARFAIAAGDAKLVLATLPSLADWLAEQRAAALATDDQGRAWFPAADAPHVQRLASAAALTPAECLRWPPADRAWLAAQDIDPSQPAPGPLLGWLEGRQGLRLHGWAWRCAAATPGLRLLAGTAVLTTPVGWTSRADAQADVLAVDPAAPQAIGFDLPLPTGVWLQAEGDAVALRVGGERAVLGGEAVRLSHADLLALWQRAADGTEALCDDDLRLLLDHCQATGVWPAPDSLLAGFVRHQAQRLGAVQQLGPALRPPMPPWAPPANWTTQAVWQLLRELNDAVRDDGSNAAAAISQLVADPRCDGDVGQGFLRSILPYACAHGALDAVLAHLWLPELRALADSSDAWALSVGLPVWAQLGDWNQVALLLQRLSAGPGGWLNTETVHAAVTLALASHGSVPADCWHGFVTLLDTAAAAVNGRAHDRHLLDALALLVLGDDRIPADAQAAAQACAWRHHRFNPDWWHALTRLQADSSRWPLELAQSRADIDVVQRFLVDCAAATPCAKTGAVLTSLWQVLALIGRPQPGSWTTRHQLATECLLAAWPRVQDADAATRQRLATWADGGEWLRFVHHPATRPLAAPANVDLLLSAATSGLPPPRAVALRRQAVAHFASVATGSALLPDPSDTVWRALATAADQGVALRLAAWALWHATLARDARAGARWAAALAATRQQLPNQEPNSAAALREAGFWLARAHAAHPQDLSLAQLAKEWGCSEPPSDAFTQLHQLVVCIVCESSRAAAVQAQVAATWGQPLQAQGVPWLVVTAHTATGEDAVRMMRHTPGADPAVAAPRVDDPGTDALASRRLHLVGPHWAPARGAFWPALADWAGATCAGAHLLCIGTDQELDASRLLQDAPHWGRDALALPDPPLDGADELDWRAGVVLSSHALGRLAAQARSRHARPGDDAHSGGAWLAQWLGEAGVAVTHRGWLAQREDAVPGGPPRARCPAVAPELALTRPAQSAAGNAQASAWIWPTWFSARMGGDADHPLQLLRSATPNPAAGSTTGGLPAITLVGVLRDEQVLLPHFVAHHRQLGVRHFVLADNGSSDGSLQWLLAQPDVTLYHVASQYRHSHYGVLWQQAMLAAHCQQQWALLADLDEFAVLPAGSHGLDQWLRAALQAQPDANAVLFQMVDRYPAGDLAQADFTRGDPFTMAPKQDEPPCIAWRLGSGAYSNAASWVSALRHRLLPGSSPTDYTSQKVALIRYTPWMRFAEGLHYASNIRPMDTMLAFAHFKYHKGFQSKVEREIARGQHFNAAQEYRNYQHMQF